MANRQVRLRVVTSLMVVLLFSPMVRNSSAADKGGIGLLANKLRALRMTDLTGQLHELFANEETKAAVLIFVASDCPIATSHQPSIKEVFHKYRDQGFEFYMIYCSSTATDEQVREHVQEHDVDMTAVIDTDQTLGRLLSAKATPEAVVIDRSGSIKYRGMIHDEFANMGKPKTVVTHYLDDALDSLIAGRPVAVESTRAFGCLIYYPRLRRR